MGNAQIQLTNTDLWLIERFQKLFGGSFHEFATKYRYKGKTARKLCYRWQASGARARGILLTFYKFLSPRRREKALATIAFTQAKL